MKKNNNTSHLKITSRAALVERVKRELERRGYPRLQMFLLVCLTGGAGFLASYGLLYAGLTSLAVRYGLAVVIAYAIFLLLLWLWLRTDADTYEGLDEAVVDILDAVPQGGARVAHTYRGGGGEFGGGGASGRWGAGSDAEPLVEFPDMPLPSADSFGAGLCITSISPIAGFASCACPAPSGRLGIRREIPSVPDFA